MKVLFLERIEGLKSMRGATRCGLTLAFLSASSSGLSLCKCTSNLQIGFLGDGILFRGMSCLRNRKP
jgi:hypothetical protein